jgi:hypothetical protein
LVEVFVQADPLICIDPVKWSSADRAMDDDTYQ